MQDVSVEMLKRKRLKCLEQLTRLEGWTSGSLVETERKSNGQSYPFHYLSRSVGGKNKITYIPSGERKAWEKMLRNGKKAKALFDDITELSIAILKSEKKEGA